MPDECWPAIWTGRSSARQTLHATSRNSSTPVNTDTIKGEAMSDITQAQADAVLSAARESARETGTPMNIAVVEAGGKNGAIIGAIGVSGSTVGNDHTIASAGAAAQR
jgi:uncharacterized protein GlcG (DUF336 family)